MAQRQRVMIVALRAAHKIIPVELRKGNVPRWLKISVDLEQGREIAVDLEQMHCRTGIKQF